jgi:hypothetical protein
MTLYKYVHQDRVDILRTNLIRYTPPALLNDPFESTLGFGEQFSLGDMRDHCDGDILGHVRAHILKNPRALLIPDVERKLDKIIEENGPGLLGALATHLPHYNKELNAVLATGFSKFLSDIGVLSLASRPDNLLMWAHYSNQHKGFVIALNEAHSTFNERRGPSDEFRYLRKVEYSRTKPAIQIKDVKIEDVLFHKSDDWSYEEEWRIVKALSDARTVVELGEEKIHLFDFPLDAIESVFVGAHMSAPDREQLISVIRGRPELAHVSIYAAKLQADVYSLRFEEVSTS